MSESKFVAKLEITLTTTGYSIKPVELAEGCSESMREVLFANAIIDIYKKIKMSPTGNSEAVN